MDKIEDRARFDYIRYANCWEDTEILCEALNPHPGKRFLSIASAGDNSLALLAGGAEVIAVDLNPSQLACVELRREAIKELEHEEFLQFIGVRESSARIANYQKIKAGLSDESRNFWENNQNIIENGLIHEGKFEKYFQLFGKKIMRLIHSRKNVEKLLEEKSKEERFRYYDKTWNNLRWRMLFKVFFSKTVMGKMGRDPEFFRYVDIPVAENILKRAKYALTELETHDNPYLTYILTGNYRNALPYYLKPEVYNNIRKNIDNLTLFKGPIQEAAVKFAEGGFDGFNLSDIFEYLDPATSESIYKTLLDNANKGARFAYWNMLVPRHCPESLKNKVNHLENLSQQLFDRDQAFFYREFIVDEVR